MRAKKWPPPQPPESRPSQGGALARADESPPGDHKTWHSKHRRRRLATRSKFHEESKAAAARIAPAKAAQSESGDVEANVAPQNAAIGEEAAQSPPETPAPALSNRKLIRNASVELEIVSFDNAVQKITAFANEEHGYVATTDSEKQANGKLNGPDRREGAARKSGSFSAKDPRVSVN